MVIRNIFTVGMCCWCWLYLSAVWFLIHFMYNSKSHVADRGIILVIQSLDVREC